MVMRFGAIQRGTLLTSQHQNTCMKGSRRDRPALLYWCSSSLLSCCRDRRAKGSSINLARRLGPSSTPGAFRSRATKKLLSESGRARTGLLCELMLLCVGVGSVESTMRLWDQIYGSKYSGMHKSFLNKWKHSDTTEKLEFIINRICFCGVV